MDVRYAIYFIPEPQTPLAGLGSALLGRDSEMGQDIPQLLLPGFSAQRLHELTTNARRYGLHATLKAPFFLKPGLTEQELLDAAAHFVKGRMPITLPRLEIARIGSFFALVPASMNQVEEEAVKCTDALAADAVSFFDSFRAASSEQEIARRNPQKLNARQKVLLTEWGYPYVFDEYRFHITLTDKIYDHTDISALEHGLRLFFNPAFKTPVSLSGICICRQEVLSKHASTATTGQNAFILYKRVQMVARVSRSGRVSDPGRPECLAPGPHHHADHLQSQPGVNID